MNDIGVQGLRSSDAAQVAKLLRMLRSTLRRYPQAKLLRTLDGFGVSLAENTSMRIRLSGSWTNADIRDLLALFATWLVVDGDHLRNGGTPLNGYSAEVIERLSSSDGRQDFQSRIRSHSIPMEAEGVLERDRSEK